MHFAHPYILFFLLILIPLIVWYVLKHRTMRPALYVSSTAPFASMRTTWKQYLRHVLFALRLLAIAAIIVAVARPQVRDSWRESTTQGTDIVLAMDISGSMLAQDFEPDRLEAAKEVATKFVNGRENDNMGVVIFAGEALTGIPMTTDRAALSNYISSIKFGMLEDGTAIGDGLATSINRIKDSKAVSKSIILLTDGTNNTGNVDPVTASEIAKQLGIKVYTIGVGTNGRAMMPSSVDYFGRISYSLQPVEIDEGTLRTIAENTGGKYFRATGNEVLRDIFEEIDRLEKSEIDVRNFTHTEDSPLTFWLLAAAGLVIMLELLLKNTVMRSIP